MYFANYMLTLAIEWIVYDINENNISINDLHLVNISGYTPKNNSS